MGLKSIRSSQALQRYVGFGGQPLCQNTVVTARVSSVANQLRCVDSIQAIQCSNVSLPRRKSWLCEAVFPTDVIPICDVKRLRNHRLPLQAGDPLIGRWAGAATLGGVKLNDRRHSRTRLYLTSRTDFPRVDVGPKQAGQNYEYSRLMAQEIAVTHDLSDEFIEYVFLFAPLHDIGKVGSTSDVGLLR